MFTLQQLLAPRGQDNIKTLQALYEGSFVCAQRLISLNLKATRSIMESNVSGIKELSIVGLSGSTAGAPLRSRRRRGSRRGARDRRDDAAHAAGESDEALRAAAIGSPRHLRSKRSRLITLFQAATKSRTNFSPESAHA